MDISRDAAGIHILVSTNEHALLTNAVRIAMDRANPDDKDYLTRLRYLFADLNTPMVNLGPWEETVSKLMDHKFVACTEGCHGDRDCHFCWNDRYTKIHGW